MVGDARDDRQAKAALRAQARSRRAALSPAVRTAHGRAMAGHAWDLIRARLPLAGPVACTWSMPTEPPTDPLITQLLQAGIEVVTPRIVDGVQLHWIRTTVDTELRAGPLGIRTPEGMAGVELAGCSVVVVPALALDRSGNRLGQGGGYFDRALAELPPHAHGGPLRIGMAFADEILPELPREEHDQPVDLILTQEGVRPALGG